MKTLTKMPPFRMIGNLYFVGTKEASCHLIDTEEGLILIDTGYEENVETILESVSALGFDIKNVKYILHSHGHYDHTDATAALLKYTPDAKTFLSHRDLKYIKGFTPDFDLHDGDTVRLGSTEILCLFTPGHTEGTFSFFFNVTENGKTYRAAMFGGAGTNQLKKAWMNKYDVPYIMRGEFFKSVERLMGERVDVMIGNHVGQNHTKEKYEMMATAEENPFIVPGEWEKFLKKVSAKLWEIIKEESRTTFVNYAHRGAPAYCPENTFLSFYTGIFMGANGIETDVWLTKDGVPVLFHDDTLNRVCGVEGCITDYTFEELQNFNVTKGELSDKIPTLEDFLAHFSHRNITFAIELKGPGVEKATADLIRKYGIEKKTVVTSFNLDYIKNMKKYAPELRIGFLTNTVDDELIEELLSIEADELCPIGTEITAENVDKWHRLGFNVRAWGIKDEELMRAVCEAGADGMTVNFPDKLTDYIAKNR